MPVDKINEYTMNEKKYISYLERYSQWIKSHKEKSNEELEIQ